MSKRQREIIEAYERDASQTPRASENMRAYYAGRLTARQAIDRGGLDECEQEYRHLLRTEWGPCPTFTCGFEAEMHLEIIRLDEARSSHAETTDVDPSGCTRRA